MNNQIALEADIINYHNAIKLDPTNTPEYQNKLNYRLSKWLETLDITIFVANNEQLPWLPGEIGGLKTRPMLTKKDIGFNQVGDYHAFVDGYGGYYLPFVVDRKTKADLYGTLMKSENRKRFYREIERFNQDSRFKQFYIFAETTLVEWLNYEPPNAKDKGNKRINQKLAVIASLGARGCSICWCDNRRVASRLYGDFVRQFCLKNYVEILNI